MKKIIATFLVITVLFSLFSCVKDEGLTDLPDSSGIETTSPDTTEDVTTTEDITTEEITTDPPPKPKTATLLAVGDNLIHGPLITSSKHFGYDKFYGRIKDTISNADLAIINQESCFTYNTSLYSGYPRFATPIGFGEAAIRAGFDVFSLATNHTWDNGKQPILDTLDFFSKHPEVMTVGVYTAKEEYSSVKTVEVNGITIALLNYTYGFNRTSEAWWMVDTMSDKTHISDHLKRAEEIADITVVIAHWGKEDVHTPNSTQLSWAQFFSDNGADIIIGHHPHVLQPLMTLTGINGNTTVCYYSLGNFISNQNDFENNIGGLASLTIVKDEAGTRVESYELIPLTVQVERANGKTSYEAILLSDLTPELLSKHYKFKNKTVGDYYYIYNQAINSYP